MYVYVLGIESCSILKPYWHCPLLFHKMNFAQHEFIGIDHYCSKFKVLKFCVGIRYIEIDYKVQKISFNFTCSHSTYTYSNVIISIMSLWPRIQILNFGFVVFWEVHLIKIGRYVVGSLYLCFLFKKKKKSEWDE